MSLKVIVEKAIAKHTASVIFIHGLGDSGAGWQPVAKMFSPHLPHVKWILPSAPPKRVTANFGMVMPSWYDIYSFGADMSKQQDENGILESKSNIETLIAEEIKSGIPAERIIVGGFSQGGAIALATALTTNHKLAGLAVLSSYVPIKEKLKEIKSQNAGSVPIFMAHGTADPLVDFSLGVMSSEALISEFGWKKGDLSTDKPAGLIFKPYSGMEHSSCPEELADLMNWLQKILPSNE